jgi:aldose 1-epimerase
MIFQVTTETRPATNGLDGTFYLLRSGDGSVGVDVWPALGFNCVRWFTRAGDSTVDWLYATPQLLEESRPTRSGIPVLFPFPNRIRDGQFTWEGKPYQLPLNDPAGKNAIHGFACRHPWTIIDQGADTNSAWVTGEFSAARDAAKVLALWPADHRLRLTCRLCADRLRLEARVDNPDQKPLPFALGYHPYFRLLGSEEATQVQVPARQFWVLEESLPTGKVQPVEPRNDLTRFRPYRELALDDVLTGLHSDSAAAEGLRCCGSVRAVPGGRHLTVLASPAFQEVVAFTPPHRQAVCLEPYTCTTDAINLQQQGTDAGLRVLAPGESWSAVVELYIK